MINCSFPIAHFSKQTSAIAYFFGYILLSIGHLIDNSKKKNYEISAMSLLKPLKKLMQSPKANRNLHNSEKTSQDWSIWPDGSLLQLLTLLQEGNLFLSVALQQNVSPAWLVLLQGDLSSMITYKLIIVKILRVTAESPENFQTDGPCNPTEVWCWISSSSIRMPYF